MSTKHLCVFAILLAWFHAAEAQQPPNAATIGWLATRSAASGTGLDRLRRLLHSLGYVEGKNITFEFRSADDKIDRLPALADDLVRRKVDVIVTPSTAETLAAKKATKAIPIVCLNVGDAVALGLVDSLAHPGGNITGFSNITAIVAGKRLELLKEAIPKLSRVAVLWYPDDPGSTPQWQESERAAQKLGLQVHSMAISRVEDYESAFRKATRAGSDALAVTQGPLSISHQKDIAGFAIKYRLPTMMPRGDFVDRGGLISYGPDRDEPYRRVASMVDRILKGAKPADLPVEQPTKFELVINLKAAKQIGLTIPPNVLARADRVIK
jgi:putative ABC transport system substrate-binding protein